MVLETGTLGCQWMRTRSKRFLYIRSNRTDHCDLGRGERKRLYVYTIMCKLRDESICKSVQRCVVNLSGLLTRAETQFASKMFPSQSRVIIYYQSLWGWWYAIMLLLCFRWWHLGKVQKNQWHWGAPGSPTGEVTQRRGSIPGAYILISST